ncbi:hypothetical protein PoB_005214500 [Plakobranchus ocellatus]|uniref:Uncharacterized protein n=1 Tax=Plakobranchus ocellatus TaxID=259542 RepID=A0AAV4C1Y4_9GAST|nr:hypothetical protein PoB_005214500 [Plakobranchus ocellatus]
MLTKVLSIPHGHPARPPMPLFYRKDKRKFRGAFWDIWALVTMAGFLATLLGIVRACGSAQSRDIKTPADLRVGLLSTGPPPHDV